ncbi:MAG: DNA-directed RNA polymerase subunit omega [Acidobacteria bacterium]|nr:DNA-directed RNA polymerase subunit omega [Acidobacteriota bacterium]
MSGQRAAQLMRGCPPRVDSPHKLVGTAQLEVASGKVERLPADPAAAPED